MKVFLVLAIASLLAACAANRPQTTSNVNAPLRAEKLQDTTVHTTENQLPANSNGSKWSQSGEPIDTTKFDKAVADAEKAAKAERSDEAGQKALAQAYFERGFALTQARQYASAIGDYRRALKHDPEHAEAKEWIDQILSIYAMLKKAPPKEGEEPPPLKVKK